MKELDAIEFPVFEDPFPVLPDEDVYVAGINGVDGLPTNYRLGKELWLPGFGFLYREALSCARTALNARMRAALQFTQEHLTISTNDSIYLTEMVTPLYQYVQGRYRFAQGSEYLSGVPLGTFKDGVRCEDLQTLTFADDSFDLILSFDVLEHVPQYELAINEMARTLKPGGHLVMTAPTMVDMTRTRTRAEVGDEGEIQHILPPEYHGNPLGEPSLCFRAFGFDLVDDLRRYGFGDSYMQFYFNIELGYWGRPEVLFVAQK